LLPTRAKCVHLKRSLKSKSGTEILKNNVFKKKRSVLYFETGLNKLSSE
jgi:hypothetical protein